MLAIQPNNPIRFSTQGMPSAQSNIVLRPYQEDGLNALWNYFASGNKGNPVLAWPTGTGKSILPAVFIQRAMHMFPGQRFILSTHVKELVEQNYNVVKDVWPNAPIGINSAGLKQRDTSLPIIFGGIQSMFNNPTAFGHRDIAFVDECFSADTEILTARGFIRFDELHYEKIAQYEPETKSIDFDMPLRWIKHPPSSPMMHVKTDKNFDILATSNHEMLVTSLSGKWHKRKLKDITAAHYCKIPVAGYAIGYDTELSNFEKLAIAFQADGSAHKVNNDNTFIAAFSFSKERKINEFINLMNCGNFSWNEVSAKRDFEKDSVKPRRRFMVYLDEPMSKDVTKYIHIENLSKQKAYDIIEYMNIWDGHIATKNTYLYTNTDKKAADLYQAIACLAGHRTNMVKVIDNRKVEFSDCYRLFITKDYSEITTAGFKPIVTDYEGDVYCVEMPKGNIITRRNGKVIITGNCHMISNKDSSMYLTFFAALKLINPRLKIIGLSATPWRMGQGYITDGGLFTDICHDITSLEEFNGLIDQGYICPLIAKPTKTEYDITNVGVSGGEYIQTQLEAAVNKRDVTYKALLEMMELGYNRRSWLIFASGVKHANEIAEMLTQMGVDCAAVHSKQPAEYNDAAIKAFKNFELRAIVNYGKLTTGFNHPGIDLIAMLRWTLSIPLWVQMLGRGTRPFLNKLNCLVLDFARNTPRLGPINDPIIPVKKGQKPGDAPVKLCNSCGAYNHASARFCCDCGAEFIFKMKLVGQAGSEELIRRIDDVPEIQTFEVTYPIYSKMQKKDKISKEPVGTPYIKATYFCGMNSYVKLVFPEHKGYPRKLFEQWWYQNHKSEPPKTTDEALKYVSEFRAPKRISVHVNKKPYPEVTSLEY